MCSSGAIAVLAICLQILGVIAIVTGFFGSLAKWEKPNGVGAGIFVVGVVALVVGTRMSGYC